MRVNKLKSRDFEILVQRLEKENKNHKVAIDELYKGVIEKKEMELIKIHEGYMEYHREIIGLIKKLDREIKEEEGNGV